MANKRKHKTAVQAAKAKKKSIKLSNLRRTVHNRWAKRVEPLIARGAVNFKEVPTFKEVSKLVGSTYGKTLTPKQFEKELSNIIDAALIFTREAAKTGKENMMKKAGKAIEYYNEQIKSNIISGAKIFGELDNIVQNRTTSTRYIETVVLNGLVKGGYVVFKNGRLKIDKEPSIQEFRYVEGNWLITRNYIRTWLTDEGEAYGS